MAGWCHITLTRLSAKVSREKSNVGDLEKRAATLNRVTMPSMPDQKPTLEYVDAENVAREWLQRRCQDRAILDLRYMMQKPYGWIFFYNSPEFVHRGDRRACLSGNGPVVVNRFDGKLTLLSSANWTGALKSYEANLPASQLTL
jgi:hypothetical protein